MIIKINKYNSEPQYVTDDNNVVLTNPGNPNIILGNQSDAINILQANQQELLASDIAYISINKEIIDGDLTTWIPFDINTDTLVDTDTYMVYNTSVNTNHTQIKGYFLKNFVGGIKQQILEMFNLDKTEIISSIPRPIPTKPN